MKASRTTHLGQYSLARADSRIQQVTVIDCYGAPPHDVAGGDAGGVRVCAPYTGVTEEGHGKGIRVLCDQDLPQSEVLRLLRKVVAAMESPADEVPL
ncbi:hypothetical protein GCM10027297_34400 [Parahaliea aestuarii]